MKLIIGLFSLLSGVVMNAQSTAKVTYLLEDEISYVGFLDPMIQNGKALLTRHIDT